METGVERNREKSNVGTRKESSGNGEGNRQTRNESVRIGYALQIKGR